MSFRFLIRGACFCLLAPILYAEFQWDIGKTASCSFIFGRSVRERSRDGQKDPLFIWLGIPSDALQVSSRHGRLPIVSLWRSYVNVLYVTRCEQDVLMHNDVFYDFLDEWHFENTEFIKRGLYLGGLEKNSNQKSSAFVSLALGGISRGYSVSGVLVGNSLHRPSARFFGHRPFETGNQMNEYAISRARNPVVCNSMYSQIEFVMNDVIFYYSPRAVLTSDKDDGMYEYDLFSVATYDTCYRDLEAFEKDWRRRSPYLSTIYPVLPTPRLHEDSPVFPLCDSEIKLPFTELLDRNITVLLYSHIYKEANPICSFYIGIFRADGVRFPEVSNFNNAAMVGIEEAKTQYIAEDSIISGISMSTIGEIQDSESTPRLVWIHLDSRLMFRKKSQDNWLVSKFTAVDIISRLLDRDMNVEYAELFV